jgi:acyl-coenzyme A synthetase/AMP-(fatty) acid ligase
VALFDQICFTHGDDDAIQLVSTTNNKDTESFSYLELQELSIVLASQLHYRYRPAVVVVDCFGHVVAETVSLLACMRLRVPFVPVSVYDQHAGAGRLETVVTALRKHIPGNVIAICGANNDQDPALGVFYKAGLYSILYVDRRGEVKEQIHVPRFSPHHNKDESSLLDDDRNNKNGDDLYILFTSGTSSGNPKAVKGSHRSTFRRLQWFRDAFEASARVARRTRLTFVDSITELFGALLHPPSVLVAVEPHELREKGLALLLDIVQPITQITLLPSQLASLFLLPKENLKSLERIIISGEPCPASLVKQFDERLSSKCQVLNLYGQTESTGDVLAASLRDFGDRAIQNGIVAVGKPILPSICITQTEKGELHIKGNLANGYLGESNPFQTIATGDVGFCRDVNEKSKIWYIQGRCDDIVKVNGTLTSPPEVESAFTTFFGTDRIAAVIFEGQVYVVCEQELPKFSRQEMFDSGVPWNLIPIKVFHHTIPFLSSGAGKADRLQLHEIVRQRVNGQFPASQSSDPQTVDSIVCDVLQQSSLDPKKSFVELGGDSATAIHLLYCLRKAKLVSDTELSARDILEAQDIEELQRILVGDKATKKPRLTKDTAPPILQVPISRHRLEGHMTITFQACVDASPIVTNDRSSFFLACQGGLLCKIDAMGVVQAYRHFPSWKFQADCLIIDRDGSESLVLVCGFNDFGKGLVATMDKQLAICWQREIDSPITLPGFHVEANEVLITSASGLIFFNIKTGSINRHLTLANEVFGKPVIDRSSKTLWYMGGILQKINYSTEIPNIVSLSAFKDSIGPCYKDILLLDKLLVLVICDAWGQIHIVDITSDTIRQTEHVSCCPLSSPLGYNDNKILVGTYAGQLMSFYIDNSHQLIKQWEVEVGASIYSRPTILPGKAECVVVTTAGDVVCVRLGDGMILERQGVDGEIWSTPKVLGNDVKAGCKVVFGARDSQAHILELSFPATYGSLSDAGL